MCHPKDPGNGSDEGNSQHVSAIADTPSQNASNPEWGFGSAMAGFH